MTDDLHQNETDTLTTDDTAETHPLIRMKYHKDTHTVQRVLDRLREAPRG